MEMNSFPVVSRLIHPDKIRTSRMIRDPEFAVEGIEPKDLKHPFVREIYPGQFAYINFAQIFRAQDENDPMLAKAQVLEEVSKALGMGKQSIVGRGLAQYRLTAGLDCLERYVGAPIDPSYLQLAVLRPLTLECVEPPPPDEEAKRICRENGFAIIPPRPYFEVTIECGLDVLPRHALRYQRR